VRSNQIFMEKVAKFINRIVPEDIILIATTLNLYMTPLKAKEAILFACNSSNDF